MFFTAFLTVQVVASYRADGTFLGSLEYRTFLNIKRTLISKCSFRLPGDVLLSLYLAPHVSREKHSIALRIKNYLQSPCAPRFLRETFRRITHKKLMFFIAYLQSKSFFAPRADGTFLGSRSVGRF